MSGERKMRLLTSLEDLAAMLLPPGRCPGVLFVLGADLGGGRDALACWNCWNNLNCSQFCGRNSICC